MAVRCAEVAIGWAPSRTVHDGCTLRGPGAAQLCYQVQLLFKLTQ